MADGPKRPIRPRQGGGAGRRRRVVIDSGAARPRPDDRRAREQRPTGAAKQPREVAPPTGPVTVPSGVTVRELSQALGVAVAQIIKIMMGLGEMVQITQSLTDEAVQLIASEVGREVTIKHADEEEVEPESYEDAPRTSPPARRSSRSWATSTTARRRCSTRFARPPSSRPRPAGSPSTSARTRPSTTAGRSPSSTRRPRGVHGAACARREGHGHRRSRRRRERRRHAADARVDRPRPRGRDADRRRGEQGRPGRGEPRAGPTGADRRRAPAGGVGRRCPVLDVSAREKRNLDDLLEKVLLVADAELELTANPKAEASGPIIESRLDVGRGPVATVLVQRGTLKVGDAIVAGDAHGKVRALQNYRGEKIKEARPGDPVEIIGFDKPPPAGELAASSRTSARRASSPRPAASGCGASSARSRRSGASRSRPCSRRCRPAPSGSFGSCSRPTSRAPSRQR